MLNFNAAHDHKLIAYIQDRESGLKGFIAIHRGNSRYPAFGATRLWHYASFSDALKDVLLLSKLMSRKTALAGLRYGGGKGVIIGKPKNASNKNTLLKAYAQRLNLLGGSFITGADVGLTQHDVKTMRKETPYVVGLRSDPAQFTALGLLYAIHACMKEIFGRETINGRSFAIQGLGKVGFELLKLIYPESKNVFVSDVNKKTVARVKSRFPNIKVVNQSEIHKQKVDVYSPCALGDHLIRKTFLKCAAPSLPAGQIINLKTIFKTERRCTKREFYTRRIMS